MRYMKTLILLFTLGFQLTAFAANIPVKLYRNPNCGCCNVYADYLKSNGFNVELINTTDLSAIHRKYAIPEKLEGCHTAIIGGYIFEGLIPAEYVKRVLNERRPIKGLSLPGMPVGAPGMPGIKQGLLNVYYITDTPTPRVFASF
ncbi:MAG: DUF411 domain-containing protein [Burkholderiales bacterium]